LRDPIVKAAVEDLAEAVRVIDRTLAGLWRDIAELGEDPSRARQCVVAALVVPLATSLALLFQVESVWWAAISGFMSIMSTGAASVRRGILRLVGTVCGAGLAFIVARWLPYDHFALSLYLGGTTMLGVIGMQVSPHGLAWLFAAITSSLVLLMGLTDPLQVPIVAFYRVFEVAIGVASAMVVANVLEDWHADPPAPMPGWRHLLGAQWPALLHGIRAAICVVVVLYVWIWIDLPDVSQMAITVAAVMAAPVAADTSLSTRHQVAERALHRVLGCLLGGVAALFCLASSVTSFPWWLAMIGGGIWICMHIQTSKRGVGYVGTQAGIVFIITLIQGSQPPASIMPGIDRFAGITGGLGILLVVALLLWPSDSELASEPRSGR
jgi:uncharacterized membrane protein YccC